MPSRIHPWFSRVKPGFHRDFPTILPIPAHHKISKNPKNLPIEHLNALARTVYMYGHTCNVLLATIGRQTQ